MDDEIVPPVIADLVSLFVFLCLVFLFADSVFLWFKPGARPEELAVPREELARPVKRKAVAMKAHPLLSEAKCDISVIILASSDSDSTITDSLRSFADYFSGRPSVKYEVFVVGLTSDSAKSEVRAFEERTNRAFRLVNLVEGCKINASVVLATLGTSGSRVFIYDMKDGLPAAILANFADALDRGRLNSSVGLVAGLWKIEDDGISDERSSWNVFLDYACRWMLSCIVDFGMRRHCRSVMLNRRALALTVMEMRTVTGSYELEIFGLAAMANVPMATVQLHSIDPGIDVTTSYDRLFDTLSAFEALVYNGYAKIRRMLLRFMGMPSMFGMFRRVEGSGKLNV